MRNRFFLLFLLTLCIGVGLVAGQDDPNDVPMPYPSSTPVVRPTIDIDPDELPFPPTSTPIPRPTVDLDPDDLPMPPTKEPLCITGNDGKTYCTYPTMEACITGADGQTYCTYPTMIPTSTVQRPTLTPDSSRIVPGYWRQTRSQTTIIGTCKAMGIGHNPDGDGDGATPVIPLIPIYQSSTADFLFINDYAYPLVQPQLYRTATTSRNLNLQIGSSGGSIETSTITEYQIISPDVIAIHYIYKEDGGCSVESSSKFELAQTDASVIHATVNDIATLQPTLTAIVEGTAVPPQQPVPPGTYPVTWTMDSGTCTAKTQPTFTQAKIDYANNGDMLLRLGDDQHTLFPVGSDSSLRYQLISSKYQITVQVLSGVIKMDWGKFASVTEMCFKSGDLSASTSSAPAATSAPFIDPTATPLATTNNQSYQISFQPDEQMCPAAIQEKLPNFNGATFEKRLDGSYQLIVDGKTLTFKDQYGYATYDGSEPSKGITYQIAAQLNGQGGMLGLTYMNTSGAMCLAQMTLSAK
ncbi:MAG: hypothetical protein GC179_07400 [Anaerolineaceae bacterium]|nr:hypothetical protein [Anaerolineaceae bacterium]